MQNIVEIRDGVTRHPLYRMKHPVNLTIAAGEQVAIVGRNGSGKSRLVDIITGRYPPADERSALRLLALAHETGERQYQIHHVPRLIRRQRQQLLLPATLEPARHRREHAHRGKHARRGLRRRRKRHGLRHDRRRETAVARAAGAAERETLRDVPPLRLAGQVYHTALQRGTAQVPADKDVALRPADAHHGQPLHRTGRADARPAGRPVARAHPGNRPAGGARALENRRHTGLHHPRDTRGGAGHTAQNDAGRLLGTTPRLQRPRIVRNEKGNAS